ncbi:DgyrCDS2236 [Dimorphilus gyrociliatus]|uniref:DgyrCDS2236 n=1 Tax=Dimorphilus gyrociliatus TaxID=2664684 RepID=A0A7I8VAY4_9ANNE|nr:DgyrCDS2236 [Dimorphilus gyrociliatus]
MPEGNKLKQRQKSIFVPSNNLAEGIELRRTRRSIYIAQPKMFHPQTEESSVDPKNYPKRKKRPRSKIPRKEKNSDIKITPCKVMVEDCVKTMGTPDEIFKTPVTSMKRRKGMSTGKAKKPKIEDSDEFFTPNTTPRDKHITPNNSKPITFTLSDKKSASKVSRIPTPSRVQTNKVNKSDQLKKQEDNTDGNKEEQNEPKKATECPPEKNQIPKKVNEEESGKTSESGSCCIM